MTSNSYMSTITGYQATLMQCIFIPHYNKYVHLICPSYIPGEYKTIPLKLNTSDCTPSSWFSMFRLIFTSFPFFVETFFSQYFHSVFYLWYLYFPTEYLYEQIASLVFLFICDLLLNSKSSGFFVVVFFLNVGKFHFINKNILWKLYIDFSMLASSEG